MAVNAKNRQKKLERKAHKRKQIVAKKSKHKGAGIQIEKYLDYPVYDCCVSDEIFEVGMGNVLLSREIPFGEVAVSAFVVDVYCLGVKEAFFTVLSKQDYQTKLKPMLAQAPEGQSVSSVEPAYARKLVEGAVEYAESLGFPPATEYKKAAKLFGAIDASACSADFVFGKDGKPFYIAGPNDNLSTSKRIIGQLQERCGEGHFDYLIEVEGVELSSSSEGK